jgi:hypothetical protein
MGQRQAALWAEAEATYREVLDLRERVLEPDHPEALLSAMNSPGPWPAWGWVLYEDDPHDGRGAAGARHRLRSRSSTVA